MKHLLPLTSLRFFAAFVVVLCHVRYAHEGQVPDWLFNFARNGFVGVNLFFVLSGFVLAYNYADRFRLGTVAFGEFMLARFARIWPAFAAALVLAFPVYVLRSQEALDKLPLLIPTHALLIHSWFPNLGEAWLFPSWTIGTEWGFYLLFPFFAAAVARLSPKGLWTLLAVSSFFMALGPALYHAGAFDTLAPPGGPGDLTLKLFWSRVLRWYSIVRLPEFLIGVCVCRLFLLQTPEQRRAWAATLRPVAAVSTLVIIVLMTTSGMPILYMSQVALTLPFAAILWFLAYGEGAFARWLSQPWLVLLGEASYSLYLIHPVVKQVVLIAGRRLFGLEPSSFLLSGLVIVFSIVASLLMFRWIEKPARKWIVARFGSGGREARGSV